MTRCALYVRVSTGKQDTENQEHLLREFASKMGWDVCATYRDEVSGGKSEHDRPGFKRMMDGASRREYDVLKAILHNIARDGPASQNRAGVPDFAAHLLGRISWVESLNAARGAKLRRAFAEIDWNA